MAKPTEYVNIAWGPADAGTISEKETCRPEINDYSGAIVLGRWSIPRGLGYTNFTAWIRPSDFDKMLDLLIKAKIQHGIKDGLAKAEAKAEGKAALARIKAQAS